MPIAELESATYRLEGGHSIQLSYMGVQLIQFYFIKTSEHVLSKNYQVKMNELSIVLLVTIAKPKNEALTVKHVLW